MIFMLRLYLSYVPKQDLRELTALESEVCLSFNAETLISAMNCSDMQHHIQT